MSLWRGIQSCKWLILFQCHLIYIMVTIDYVNYDVWIGHVGRGAVFAFVSDLYLLRYSTHTLTRRIIINTQRSSELKERQIATEINRLANSVAEFTNRIDILFNRLTPALRVKVEPPICDDEGKTAVESELVEFASVIRQIRYIVEGQDSLINSVLNRLEI